MNVDQCRIRSVETIYICMKITHVDVSRMSIIEIIITYYFQSVWIIYSYFQVQLKCSDMAMQLLHDKRKSHIHNLELISFRITELVYIRKQRFLWQTFFPLADPNRGSFRHAHPSIYMRNFVGNSGRSYLGDIRIFRRRKYPLNWRNLPFRRNSPDQEMSPYW